MVRIIAGEWGGRRIETPSGREVRPTSDRVREAWMSAMAPSLPDARVLDLFAGSGALGLECLSRGAREAVFVDRSPVALSVLRGNVRLLGAEDRVRIVSSDAFRFLDAEPSDFDVAVADPPYDRGLASRLVDRFVREPFAGQFWIEHSSTETLSVSMPSRRREYGGTAITSVLPPDRSPR